MPDNDDYDVLLSEHEAGEPDAVVLDGLLCRLFVGRLVPVNQLERPQRPAVVGGKPLFECGDQLLLGHGGHGLEC